MVAIVIASVQLVPALMLKRASSRAHDLVYEDAVAWSMPLDRPVELLWAHAFGRISDDSSEYRGAARYRPPRMPLIFSIYCGVAVPLLVLAGLFTHAPWRWWAVALALLSYALAIGGNGPFVRWLYEIGVWRSIRYPEKFVLFGLFALIVFASIVLDRLDHRLAALILVLTLGDVALHIGELAPRMPRRFFTEVLPLARALRSDARLFHAAAWPVWKQPMTFPRAPLTYWAEREVLLPFTSALYGLRGAAELDINLTNLQPTADFVQAMWEAHGRGAPLEPWLAEANVEWIVAPSGSGVRPVRIVPRPRYEFVSNGEVLKVFEAANSVKLEVDAHARALLLIRVTHDRHWRADIDGDSAPLVRAHIGYMALTVPPGAHSIILRYRDPLMAVCGLASILALIAAIIVALQKNR